MQLQHPMGFLWFAVAAWVVPELVFVWVLAAVFAWALAGMLARARATPPTAFVVPRHIRDAHVGSTTLVFVVVMATAGISHVG